MGTFKNETYCPLAKVMGDWLYLNTEQHCLGVGLIYGKVGSLMPKGLCW